MEAQKDHTIAFTGLKDGSHHFRMVLEQDFFEASGEEDLLGGQVDVEVELDKSATMLVTNIHTKGTVGLLCDHCNAPLDMAVDGWQRQIFQLGGDPEEDDAELVSLPPEAHQVDLTHYIYECLRLALPMRRVHPEGQCDPEVEQALQRVAAAPMPETDPRWEALRKLK